MYILGLFSIFLFQDSGVISGFEALEPKSIQRLPASWVRSLFAGEYKDRERWNYSLISEDGKRLYVGVSMVNLTSGECHVREVFQSASVPGTPIVGSWQTEALDYRLWRREEDDVFIVRPLSEPSPTSLVVAHHAQERYDPDKGPISRYSFGISQLEFGSQSACDNRSLLRLSFSGYSSLLLQDTWLDIGTSRTLISSAPPVEFFFFDEGRIQPVSSIPITWDASSILCVASNRGILIEGCTSPKEKNAWINVQSFHPGRGFRYLETIIRTEEVSDNYAIQATVLPGTRALVTLTPKYGAKNLQSRAFVVDYFSGKVQEAGPYSILATSRSGKRVLLGSISWDEPAYLLHF